jgi:CheY-like chemotaxis protein
MSTPTELFSQHVRDALGHLHAISYLEAHALARELLGADRSAAGRELRRLLLEAIDELRPAQVTPASQAHARRHQQLVLRYVDGLTPEQIARELTLSPRQASRDLQQALHELTLLLWSRRVEAAPASLETPPPEDADLLAVTTGAVATLRKLLGGRPPRVRLSIPDTLPPVAVEPDLLRQALLNLLMYVVTTNADARAVVSANDSASGVVLRIGLETRTGQPFDLPPPEPDHALLESGQRMLGMIGGTLEIGPVLGVLIPAVSRHRVLVVDDNPDVVGLFRRYLRGRSYRVIQATSGVAALRLAREFQPHLVVLDVLLPARDGWEILSDLRAMPGLASTPVVICSVLPERAMARSLNVADFLPKPITRQSLLDLLERWCPPPLDQPAPPVRS